MRMEMQGKLKDKTIDVLRCASLDFESPAPQASKLVAKERKSVVGNRLLSRGGSCHPVAQSGLVTGVLSRGAKAQNRGIANGVCSRKAF